MTTLPQRKLKIGVYSMDGVGHISACAGVMQPLIARGHDVFFIASSAFEGKLLKYGAREVLLAGKLTPEEEEASKEIVKNVGIAMVNCGFIGSGSSIDKMRVANDNGFLEFHYKTLVEFEPKIAQILEEEKPDLLLLDHFMMPPSFVKSGIPVATIHSCSPLMAHSSAKLPPPFSGYPTNSDPETWKDYQDVCMKYFFEPLRDYQERLFKAAGLPKPEYDTYMYMSEYLNIYAYPKELDYGKIVEKRSDCFQIDAFARDEPYTGGNPLPEDFINRPEGVKLVYFSLGSMGGVDIDLMKRITSWLAESPHKFVVVKGPRGDEYELNSPNIFSGNFLPQPAILPLVDLVITHGGNNTTTETFFAAKPMIVLPLFADQYDNARRVEECNFGVQFNPYLVEKEEFMAAIEKLLADEDVKVRLQAATDRLKRDDLKVRLAERLEEIAEKYSSNHGNSVADAIQQGS